MVYVNSPLYLPVFVDYLVVIGDPTDAERVFQRGANLEVCSGGVVMAKMRLPSWYGLAIEGGDGEAICWWVSCNR